MTGVQRFRPKPDDPLEHSIQVKVLDVIDTQKAHVDIYAFAIPNAGRRGFQTAMKMKSEGMKSGVADICAMLPDARCAWLEMKRLKGKQSTNQLGFEARCKRLGHPYRVAHTLDEAVIALREMGVIR